MVRTESRGWTCKTLRDLATINYGKSPKEILAADGLYPVVGTGGTERYGDGFLYDGDSVILGRKGTIDRVHFVSGRFWTIDTAYFLSDFGDTQPRWLFYFLQNFDLRQLNEATGVPSLSRDLLYRIEVETPPTPEQAKIAEILSTVDQAIEQTEALIVKQQRIKTGLMQDLLTRGIDENGNLRSEETHEFKDSPLGRIPVEWGVKSVGRVFSIQLGKMLSKESKTGEDPFPYVGNKNVQWERIDSNAVEWMDFSPREREKFMLAPGDILVCEGGEVGRSCVWQGEISNCFYQKAVHRLRPKGRYNTKLFPKFMRWAISRGVLSDFTSQTSISHLTKEKLEALPITIQSEEEQARICRVFDCVDASVLSAENQLGKLTALKTALMQDLLTGKVSVAPLLTDLT